MGDRSDIDVDTTDGIVVSGQVLVRATGTIDLERRLRPRCPPSSGSGA